MAKPHIFRNEAGELLVYPTFVADSNGYDVIVWDDWTEGYLARIERVAHDVALDKWAAKHGDAPPAERRTDLGPIGRGTRGAIRVWFSNASNDASQPNVAMAQAS